MLYKKNRLKDYSFSLLRNLF